VSLPAFEAVKAWVLGIEGGAPLVWRPADVRCFETSYPRSNDRVPRRDLSLILWPETVASVPLEKPFPLPMQEAGSRHDQVYCGT
jgi:hypothetical protein